ncbi:hypothetical protein [Haloglycomyces albus]|uniref:hypothetical protein n=1 Tax=Haloglycomyces albus TaxID=526067 RepID=UPI0012EB0954|nr:hypothetical protein [Haloglycomyces albus]
MTIDHDGAEFRSPQGELELRVGRRIGDVEYYSVLAERAPASQTYLLCKALDLLPDDFFSQMT